MLAARRTDGAEQFFSRAVDFGFSKNSDETFRIWNKEHVLADAVWVIRKFRPDIIITRFPEDERAGHGHHAASAIIAREAFIAAADPKRFPEQLKYVEAWQARQIVWNTYNFGSMNTTAEDQLKLEVGAFNALLGKGYGEIAAESRSHHKSQGFGSARQRGQAVEYFIHTAGILSKNDLFEGINYQWNRIPGGEEIGKLIHAADKNFNSDAPSASVPALVKILKVIESLPEGYWKEQKSKELKLPVVLLGISYKPNSPLEIGSPARLLEYFLKQKGCEPAIVDPWVYPGSEIYQGRAVYFVSSRHSDFADLSEIKDSLVIDPWGHVLTVGFGSTLLRPGRENEPILL